MPKTNNANLVSKLLIRRYFLDMFHAGKEFRIFDACQGEKVLWNTLQKDYRCIYWGVDQKPKPGRMKIDSTRILEQPGWDFDVIDIDTHGHPWNQWLSLLPNISRPVTVFLTIGTIRAGGNGGVGKSVLRIAAPKFRTGVMIPLGIMGSLAPFFATRMLAQAFKYGLEISYAAESSSSSNARYLGIRLEPK